MADPNTEEQSGLIKPKDPQNNSSKETAEPFDTEEVEKKSPVSKTFSETFMGMVMQSGLPSLAQKMTPTNIDNAINKSDLKDQRRFILKKRSQWFKLAWVVIAVGVLIFLILIFKEDKDTLFEILKSLAFLITGFLGGWGYSRLKIQD